MIAFALETSDGEARAAASSSAERRLHRPQRSERPERGQLLGTVLDANGVVWRHEDTPKPETAARLVELVGG